MTLRPIAAIPLPDLVPGMDAVAEPIFELVDPTLLKIEEEYQRNITVRSVEKIRKMVAAWSWRKFKPPTCAMTEDGLVILDGQHTSIAACCHPDITSIPIMIIDAIEVSTRAASFIGINKDRLAVSPTQLHAAGLIAGEEDALAIQRVTAAAGIVVLKSPPSNGKFEPNQTVAISTIQQLLRRRGEEVALKVLKVLAEASVVGIRADHIKAVEAMLLDVEFGQPDPDAITAAIVATSGASEREAKLFASTHSTPIWRGLVDVWFKKCRKKSRATGADEKVAPAVKTKPAPAPSVSPPRAGCDPRPSRGGWSPGPFARRCAACDESFVGGSSALMCAACAYGDER